MIIFLGDGRLGNQIFQYGFIMNFYQDEEIIITTNFNQLIELFEVKVKLININNRYLRYIMNNYIKLFIKLIAYLRIISSVKSKKVYVNKYLIEDSDYIFKHGMLPIKYVFEGVYQSEKLINMYNKQLKIKYKYINEATKIIYSLPQNTFKIFVHIRRTDYSYHSCLGYKDIRLPLNYYMNAIKSIISSFNNVYFIFLSDDIDYVTKNFKNIENKYISNNNEYVDFSIMSLCEGGILSNSSFSWWGAYFIKNKNIIISPKYWIGFKSKIEYPRGITPSFSLVYKVD